MGSSHSKSCKADRYRALSPCSDTESTSASSSIASNAAVAKRLSQAEPPCRPSPAASEIASAHRAFYRSIPEEALEVEAELRRRIDSCGGTVSSPIRRGGSLPSQSPPPDPLGVDRRKWPLPHEHLARHGCAAPSEASSKIQYVELESGRKARGISSACGRGLHPQPRPQPQHRRRGGAGNLPPASMAPADENHRWTWNLQPDMDIGARVPDRDINATVRRMYQLLRSGLSHPIGEHEEYEVEMRLTKVQKPVLSGSSQQKRPHHRCQPCQQHHHHQPETAPDVIYSVPLRRPYLLARDAAMEHSSGVNQKQQRRISNSHHKSSDLHKDLSRIIAQNHERNNVALHPPKTAAAQRERLSNRQSVDVIQARHSHHHPPASSPDRQPAKSTLI
ncbi:hypothetical protein BV898_11804 [Hypsibius exemplaris]|uniref:Uncharacterized protein n=1 Tax=Hypsibius exemplaris TaxID=2072580 RepID=A0A1W0WFZ0_HYPEX|nr:hypothetical protein BV898_11804 [Hypsibius exemplaris]